MNLDIVIIALVFYIVGIIIGYGGFIFLKRKDGTLYITETDEKDVVKIELEDLDTLKRHKWFLLRVVVNSQK